MKKPGIGKLRTVITIQTNVQKVLYGSGRVGAGFVDQYTTLKIVRGKFESFNGRRVLANGAVTFAIKYRLTVRFDIDVSNAIDKQMRFSIHDKLYTLDSFKYNEEDKQMYIEFTLDLYSK